MDLDDHRRLPDGGPVAAASPSGRVDSGSHQLPCVVVVLDRMGKHALTIDELVSVSISPAFAVVLAYFGARMIYAISLDVSRARLLGAYQLESRIGAGGMGEVWRASHRMLVRPAAIKLIAPHQLGDDAHAVLTRFEQEAQATALLRSPHTVEVYDFGRSDDGSFYYVMELLDGVDLQELVRTHGPLPASRVVHILRQACHSLAEAHAAGLVHRDIKPANIFVCRYGSDFDFVKVLDFGLVKHDKAGDETDPNAHTRGLDHRHSRLSVSRSDHRSKPGRSPLRYLLDGLRRLLAAHRRARIHSQDSHGNADRACHRSAHSSVTALRAPHTRGS